MAQLNIICDEAAKNMGTGENHEETPQDLHSSIWEVTIGGERIINKMEKRIREWIHDPALEKWYDQNEVLPMETHLHVDWHAIKEASKITRKRQLMTVTKLLI